MSAAGNNPGSAGLEAEILRLTALRGVDKSVCPSEVARAVHAAALTAPGQPAGPPQWQSLMTPVRQAAQLLARAGSIEILRKGKPIDPDGVIKGVIRLRLKAPLP